MGKEDNPLDKMGREIEQSFNLSWMGDWPGEELFSPPAGILEWIEEFLDLQALLEQGLGEAVAPEKGTVSFPAPTHQEFPDKDRIQFKKVLPLRSKNSPPGKRDKVTFSRKSDPGDFSSRDFTSLSPESGEPLHQPYFFSELEKRDCNDHSSAVMKGEKDIHSLPAEKRNSPDFFSGSEKRESAVQEVSSGDHAPGRKNPPRSLFQLAADLKTKPPAGGVPESMSMPEAGILVREEEAESPGKDPSFFSRTSGVPGERISPGREESWLTDDFQRSEPGPEQKTRDFFSPETVEEGNDLSSGISRVDNLNTLSAEIRKKKSFRTPAGKIPGVDLGEGEESPAFSPETGKTEALDELSGENPAKGRGRNLWSGVRVNNRVDFPEGEGPPESGFLNARDIPASRREFSGTSPLRSLRELGEELKQSSPGSGERNFFPGEKEIRRKETGGDLKSPERGREKDKESTPGDLLKILEREIVDQYKRFYGET